MHEWLRVRVVVCWQRDSFPSVSRANVLGPNLWADLTIEPSLLERSLVHKRVLEKGVNS